MGTTHIVACLDASSARLTQVAKPRARVRLGDAVGCVDCTDTGAVRYLPGHRRARTRQPFQLGMGAGQHGFRWAGPAQIILISTLGSGATAMQAAVAVTLSAI